ncbi:hypothetical protein R5R35_009001 [Gryllus longicercus]|uniref:Uncharacterized protein n=1 Tax=Gryllus longicercus TaxID=2509291 RepID=A0AAN9Z5M4_9ORTH
MEHYQKNISILKCLLEGRPFKVEVKCEAGYVCTFTGAVMISNSLSVTDPALRSRSCPQTPPIHRLRAVHLDVCLRGIRGGTSLHPPPTSLGGKPSCAPRGVSSPPSP